MVWLPALVTRTSAREISMTVVSPVLMPESGDADDLGAEVVADQPGVLDFVGTGDDVVIERALDGEVSGEGSAFEGGVVGELDAKDGGHEGLEAVDGYALR